MSPSFSGTEYSDKVVHAKHPFPVDKNVVKLESEFGMEIYAGMDGSELLRLAFMEYAESIS